MKKLLIFMMVLVAGTASSWAIAAFQANPPTELISQKASFAYPIANRPADIITSVGSHPGQFQPVLASVSCPTEAVTEQETCGDDVNSGCLMEEGSEQFEAISCGNIICGTYWSNEITRDLDWYELTLAERGFVKWTAVGEAPTRIWIYNGDAGCSDPIYLASDMADPEDTASVELELTPGIYWLVIGPDDWFNFPCDGSGDYTNDYTAFVTCELGTPIISVSPDSIYAEAWEGFSTTATLNVSNIGAGRLNFTAQATQDIILTTAKENIRAINPQDITINSLIASQKPLNYDEEYASLLESSNGDEYEQTITTVECPGDGIDESETCGDDINGGCTMNAGSETFEYLACNTTVCGTVWSDGSTRDTDWYLLSLTEPTLFTWSVTADFPVMTILLLPGSSGDICDGYEAMTIYIADPGEEIEMITSLPTGDYWLWIGPTGWYNMPCDGSGEYTNNYIASLTCEPPWLSIDLASGTIHAGDDDVIINVLLDAAELEPATYTGNITLKSNDETNSPLEVPVVFVVGKVYSYLPGDANMTSGIWPAEISGADITYLVGYFRMLNPSCQFEGFYAAADANGNCSINGSDVTYLVQYFHGVNPLPKYCPDFPHMPPTEDNYPECEIVAPPSR